MSSQSARVSAETPPSFPQTGLPGRTVPDNTAKSISAHVFFEFRINRCCNTRTESVAKKKHRKKNNNVHISRECKKYKNEVGLDIEKVSPLPSMSRPSRLPSAADATKAKRSVFGHHEGGTLGCRTVSMHVRRERLSDDYGLRISLSCCPRHCP
jgi:hypothetical protein